MTSCFEYGPAGVVRFAQTSISRSIARFGALTPFRRRLQLNPPIRNCDTGWGGLPAAGGIVPGPDAKSPLRTRANVSASGRGLSIPGRHKKAVGAFLQAAEADPRMTGTHLALAIPITRMESKRRR